MKQSSLKRLKFKTGHVTYKNLVRTGAPHIEMNLACGLMDLKDPAAHAAADRTMQGAGMPAQAPSDSDNESDSDDSQISERDAGGNPGGMGLTEGAAPGSPAGAKRGRKSQHKRTRIKEL